MRMLICNGRVFSGKHGFFCGSVRIKGKKFEKIYREDVLPRNQERIIDAKGGWVIPGLVDIHLHGCAGYDFGDASEEALQEIAVYQAEHGITTICPTTMTMPVEQILRTLRTIHTFCSREELTESEAGFRGAQIAGIHLEGPFLSPEKKGSQESGNIAKPDPELFLKFQKAAGNRIRLLDLAPEREGALELIRRFRDQVVISLAHSSADYDTAVQAFRAGASHVTHLYNAMSPYGHREPGIVGAAGDNPACMVELIADGMHNHPSVVRNTFRMFGTDRIVLISDSMRAAGMGDGTYELGGHTVYVREGRALLADGTIAASVTNLFACMRRCVKNMGISLYDAVKCASLNPARSIGIDAWTGSIEEGKIADALILDRESLELQHVIHRGRLLREP